jgi:sucrose phosphatase-like protein
MSENRGLYIILVSVHGLIRGHNLELGRDADTGGQTKYVVELACALANHPKVDRVDLVTRLVSDPKVSSDYAKPIESLNDKAQIIRLPNGPRRYLRKEVLWPYLDGFADELLRHIRMVGRSPDVIHSHYADAGYVGCRVAGWLGVPLVHTGHSLGRVKQQRLIEQGTKPEAIEEHFHISTRIEAEEMTLASAALVIASTCQEVEEQYGIYDHYQPERMVVIPPGVVLERFYPLSELRLKHRETVNGINHTAVTANGAIANGTAQTASAQASTAYIGAAQQGALANGASATVTNDGAIEQYAPPIQQELSRFLTDPHKPFILALSRPAIRKNVGALVKAYGEDPELQRLANLVLVLGSRDDISTMESGPRQVMTDLLMMIDKYDLYGKVAYPKRHASDDVPDLYRLAAKQRGVFINPALTEPFGLTLIEASACGVPIVATADGGPRDILAACQNGLLIDPLNIQDIQSALRTVLTDTNQWKTWSDNGFHRVRQHFSWTSHVNTYLDQVLQLPQRRVQSILSPLPKAPETFLPDKNRLPTADRFLICEIDNTLLGDQEALKILIQRLRNESPTTGVGIATGRNLKSTLEMLEAWRFPMPDLLITSVGSEIYYGPQVVIDTYWQRHIDYRWQPDAIQEAMHELPGLELQSPESQGRFKISYLLNPEEAPNLREIMRHLRQRHLHVKAVYSHSMYLDLLPLRASKGDALRYCALKWGLPIKQFLVAGASGNDESMLTGNTMAVVVGNYSTELEKLRDCPQIYFAKGKYAWGILEALDQYNFFGSQPLRGLETVMA